MINDFNIEDLFNNEFNDLSVKPKNTVWENIEQDLNYNFPENEYKSKFSNFKFTPKSDTWRRIAFKLWLVEFTTLSLKKFNIYYAASIIGLLVSSILTFNSLNNNTLKTNLNLTNKKTVIIKNNISTNNISENTTKAQQKNNLTNKTPEITDTIKSKSKVKSNFINSTTTKADKTTTDKTTNLAENREPIYITKYIKDTVFIRDTLKIIIKDTIYKEKDIIKQATEFSPWSIDAFYSPMLLNISSKNLAEQDKNFSGIYNWSVGLNLNYKVNNISIQSGLAYSQFLEKFTFYDVQTNSSIDKRYMPIGTYSYVNKYTDWVICGYHSETRIDTTSASYEITQYETPNALVIDTVWSYEIDTTFITIADSNEIVKYDTITAIKYDSLDVIVIDTVKSFYEVINKYSYLEIPLIFDYHFNSKNNLSYVIGGGLISGIFVNAQGKGITLSNTITDINNLPLVKLNLTGVLNAGIHYKLTPKISIIFEGVYRKSFNSIYDKTYFIDKRFSSIGARFALKYSL